MEDKKRGNYDGMFTVLIIREKETFDLVVGCMAYY